MMCCKFASTATNMLDFSWPLFHQKCRQATMRPMINTSFPLEVAKITAYCSPSAQTIAVEVVSETGSTNADLLARLEQLQRPTLLIAETQTAGRGRAGRSWLSAPGGSLTFSLAWCFPSTPQALLGLPLAVGVALAEALSGLDVAVQLKWPNDVLKDGRKLAGVLIETAHAQANNSPAPRTWAVIGVGLNLLLPEELERQIDRPVADAAWLAQMDRNQIVACLLNQLAQCLLQFSAQGFSAFVARWNALHAYTGQQVHIVDQGVITQQGKALGVDLSGCLLLQDQQGLISSVMAGDVSLRPLD
jgi:BirA family biotin operon repressor/biotin-[acetyl-CoA-carboxylase] ligase